MILCDLFNKFVLIFENAMLSRRRKFGAPIFVGAASAATPVLEVRSDRGGFRCDPCVIEGGEFGAEAPPKTYMLRRFRKRALAAQWAGAAQRRAKRSRSAARAAS